jgi:hypothetical protein
LQVTANKILALLESSLEVAGKVELAAIGVNNTVNFINE